MELSVNHLVCDAVVNGRLRVCDGELDERDGVGFKKHECVR